MFLSQMTSNSPRSDGAIAFHELGRRLYDDPRLDTACERMARMVTGDGIAPMDREAIGALPVLRLEPADAGTITTY